MVNSDISRIINYLCRAHNIQSTEEENDFVLENHIKGHKLFDAFVMKIPIKDKTARNQIRNVLF